MHKISPNSLDSAFPFDEWTQHTQAAIQSICTQGLELLNIHTAASEKANETAQHWQFEVRQKEQAKALHHLLAALHPVMMALDEALQNPNIEHLQKSTQAIDEHLPTIEESFLTIRHSALDLLQWTQRTGLLEESLLPAQYRALFAQLITYAPRFKQRIEALQQILLQQSQTKNTLQQPAKNLLSAITRYQGVSETAKEFIQTILHPPLELVFQETTLFLNDLHLLDPSLQNHIASEINDCCQCLLYHPQEFNRRTQKIDVPLAPQMDSSLFCLQIDDFSILFSADDDPLFGQLIITLYRLITNQQQTAACTELINTLYADLR